MSLFVERKVFNQELVGKPCKLEGHSHEGDRFNCYVLIHSVEVDTIRMLRQDGRKLRFTEEDFDHGEDSLDITVMEVEGID